MKGRLNEGETAAKAEANLQVIMRQLASEHPKTNEHRPVATAANVRIHPAADRLLKPIEEVELGRRAQKGDEDAVQELVRANLRFVISVAKKYQNRGLPLIDLIGEGNVGLLTAARKFDPDQGVKFISYAVWWIRQAILSSLARQGRVKAAKPGKRWVFLDHDLVAIALDGCYGHCRRVRWTFAGGRGGIFALVGSLLLEHRSISYHSSKRRKYHRTKNT